MSRSPSASELRAEHEAHVSATRASRPAPREADSGYSLPAITSALYRAGLSAEQVDVVMLELGADHGPVDRERCRTARRITHNGETHTIGGWADRLGLSEWTLRHRLRAGWTIEDALRKPRRAGARTYGGGDE